MMKIDKNNSFAFVEKEAIEYEPIITTKKGVKFIKKNFEKLKKLIHADHLC